MSTTNNKTNRSKERATTCPISGNPKPRRYAVARSVWASATGRQKEEWASNAKPGTLRRMSVRPVRGK